MRRLFGGIATAVSLGLGVTPALGAPVLSPAHTISPKPAPVAEPVLAASGNGRALAAWDVVDETTRNEGDLARSDPGASRQGGREVGCCPDPERVG